MLADWADLHMYNIRITIVPPDNKIILCFQVFIAICVTLTVYEGQGHSDSFKLGIKELHPISMLLVESTQHQQHQQVWQSLYLCYQTDELTVSSPILTIPTLVNFYHQMRRQIVCFGRQMWLYWLHPDVCHTPVQSLQIWYQTVK